MFYGNFSEGRDEAFKKFLETLKQSFPTVHAEDNLIALSRSVGFLKDKRFRGALLKHAKTYQEWSLAWRLHTLTWAADHCLQVEGDYVECGVWQGFSFGVIAEYLEWEKVDRCMYLYDTYEGIPPAYNTEMRSNQVYEDKLSSDRDAIYNVVVERFRRYRNVKIVRGTVPDTFQEVCPEKIAFMHIDMNSSRSEIAALDVLWDRITPGGIVVFDDYGWFAYAKQKVAEDAWMAQRGHHILELPTGQGLVIKRPSRV